MGGLHRNVLEGLSSLSNRIMKMTERNEGTSNTQKLCDLQDRIHAEIINDNQSKLQRLINEVAVLSFKRIRQLTKCEFPSSHDFVRCCNWFETYSILPADIEVSKNNIMQKIQAVMNEIEYHLAEKVFYPAQYRDVVCFEESIISSIIDGNVPEVNSDEIVSRFLWIVYAHVMNLSSDDTERHTELMSWEAFSELTKGHIHQKSWQYQWKGYVMDAALLAKTKAEMGRGLKLSMSMNGYSISARITSYINTHNEISKREIKNTLQRAIDLIYYVDKGNGTNTNMISSRDVRWFCSLFDQDNGAILIETPTLNTPRKLMYECLKQKLVLNETMPKSNLKEKELKGKVIYCYDGVARVSGESDVPIFISQGTITCQRHGHILANVKAVVRTVVDKTQKVSIPIQKCLKCEPNRFFINQTTLDSYEREYGCLYFRHLPDSEENFSNPLAWLCHSTESLLHKLGYNVREKNGVSTAQRHELLKSIISKKELLKSEIMQHIDMLIRQHENDDRYISAVNKWRIDLSFLANQMDTDEVYNGYLYR